MWYYSNFCLRISRLIWEIYGILTNHKRKQKKFPNICYTSQHITLFLMSLNTTTNNTYQQLLIVDFHIITLCRVRLENNMQDSTFVKESNHLVYLNWYEKDFSRASSKTASDINQRRIRLAMSPIMECNNCTLLNKILKWQTLKINKSDNFIKCYKQWHHLVLSFKNGFMALSHTWCFMKDIIKITTITLWWKQKLMAKPTAQSHALNSTVQFLLFIFTTNLHIIATLHVLTLPFVLLLFIIIHND